MKLLLRTTHVISNALGLSVQSSLQGGQVRLAWPCHFPTSAPSAFFTVQCKAIYCYLLVLKGKLSIYLDYTRVSLFQFQLTWHYVR